MHNKSNTFRLNKKGSEGSLLNSMCKAVDGFQSFLNVIKNRYKWIQTNMHDQTKIFRLDHT